MFKKLLVLFLLIILILTGCSVTREKLLPQMDKKLQKLDGYYAEMEAVVFSTEGEQTYQIKQWLELPSKWRVEVTTGEDAQHFISDGKQIWVCQPGIGDYYRMDANSQSEELAAPFMLTGYLRQLQQAADFQFTDNDDVLL